MTPAKVVNSSLMKLQDVSVWQNRKKENAMRKLILSCLVLVLLLATLQNGSAGSQEPRYEMGTFYLALLLRNPDLKTQPPTELVQKHLNHLSSLVEKQKVIALGPFVGEGAVSGIVVMDVSTPEEARALMDEDPVVKAGNMKPHILKWWAAKGIMKRPAIPLDPQSLSVYHFGLIRRGPKWTPERTPETERLQAGHMANINAMAAAGKLVIAGPFENGGEYAGVFVFKGVSLQEAKDLSAADPAVKAGRLVVDVYPWFIPKNSLP